MIEKQPKSTLQMLNIFKKENKKLKKEIENIKTTNKNLISDIEYMIDTTNKKNICNTNEMIKIEYGKFTIEF